MKVALIAYTVFDRDEAMMATEMEYLVEEGRATGGADLTEFAGRACYQSWSRPNPKTATNEGYLEHILEVGHFSVLEHASASFYITDVSRSLTHELIRHRHLSPSQLSQRFVKLSTNAFVVPPLFQHHREAIDVLENAWYHAITAYDQLMDMAENMPEVKRKEAREAARAVLPNMAPTAIVLTGNHRAWREMILKRATPAADAEICELAVELFTELRELEPNVYQDLDIMERGGRRVVVSKPLQIAVEAETRPLAVGTVTTAVQAGSVSVGGQLPILFDGDRGEVETVDNPRKRPHLYNGNVHGRGGV